MKLKQKRNRGIILTREGWQKLQNARLESEIQENFGSKYTLEELSECAEITPVTLRKVLTREEGVDKRTLVRLFMAFNLELNESDYSKPDQDSVRLEGTIPKNASIGERQLMYLFYMDAQKNSTR